MTIAHRSKAVSAALVAVGLAIGTAASAQNSGNNALASGDRKFVNDAAQGGLAEVELGQLAAQKAQDPQVKQFGQRMVDDHTKANDELKRVASAKGLQVPSDLPRHDQREYDHLQKLSGADFDREFMKGMVKDHRKT